MTYSKTREYRIKYYLANKQRLKEQAKAKREQKLGRKTRVKQEDGPWAARLYDARNRCRNPKNTRYRYYGARGIKCLLTRADLKELWFRDKAYELKKPSLDRVNSGGNYEYSNCRFIELGENARRVNYKRGSWQYECDKNEKEYWERLLLTWK